MQLAKIGKICKVWYAKYSKNCKVEDANTIVRGDYRPHSVAVRMASIMASPTKATSASR